LGNKALQIEKLLTGTIASGDVVIFDTIVYSAGNISYDTATGVITFHENGRYVLSWWVATQSSISQIGAVFALASSQGDLLEGNSPIKTGEVVGFGIIDIPIAPVTVSLINLSAAAFFLSSTVPVKATLIVIEDNTGDTGPAGPTGDTEEFQLGRK
jgi:hypothetical protein